MVSIAQKERELGENRIHVYFDADASATACAHTFSRAFTSLGSSPISQIFTDHQRQQSLHPSILYITTSNFITHHQQI